MVDENSKPQIDYCTEFKASRGTARGVDLGKLMSGEDIGIPAEAYKNYLEGKANDLQDKYSCKEPDSTLMKRDNPLTDQREKWRDDALKWAFKQAKQGLKNIGDGLNKISGIKAPSKEQMSDFKNAQGGAQQQSNLRNTAKEAQKQNLNKQWKDYYDKHPNQSSNNQLQDNTGLSNSNEVARDLIKKPDLTQVNIPNYPTPEVSSIGAIIGNMIGSFAGLALGTAVSGLIPNVSNAYPNGVWDSNTGQSFKFHTGGVVPGDGEILSVLMGGETVRTEAQEKELQQLLVKNHLETYAPMICGEDSQTKENNDKKQADSQQQKKPIHQQLTKDDESFILSLVVDALERNRMGLRTTVKAI